eukprot:4344092-Karenia_brevis.AAC.1
MCDCKFVAMPCIASLRSPKWTGIASTLAGYGSIGGTTSRIRSRSWTSSSDSPHPSTSICAPA